MSKELGYCEQTKHQINLNNDSQPLRRIYCSMNLDERKATKKIVEELEDAKLIEPTHSYSAAPSILVRKKDGN